MPDTIQKGDTGSDVALCQERLNVHGYTCTVDGIFGSGTEQKVMQFQGAEGLAMDGIVGPATWEALMAEPAEGVEPPHPLPVVLEHLKSLGHKVMWQGDYHLNLFGIRSPNAKANSFDDVLGCAWTENGVWKVAYWPGTTDPGTYYLENPVNVDGTAILVPGQYTAWVIGLHGGKYEALSQEAGTVRVYRDNNKDDILDMDPATAQTGWYGINIHRATSSGESTEVNKWSAGCQVHARADCFDEMMCLARKQVARLGIETFTFTLMDQWW